MLLIEKQHIAFREMIVNNKGRDKSTRGTSLFVDLLFVRQNIILFLDAFVKKWDDYP